jgi:hypothetical protein
MTAPARKPGRPREIDPDDLLKALEMLDGNISAAAKHLGFTPQGVRQVIRREPELTAALAEIRDNLIDEAEGSLLAAVRSGEGWAVCFALRNWGRHRGYGGPPPPQPEEPKPEPTPIDLAGMSTEALMEIKAAFDPSTDKLDYGRLSQATRDELRAAIARGRMRAE